MFGMKDKLTLLNKVVSVPTDKILPNPTQPRKYFEETALLELAESIRENGLLQPINIRRTDDGNYELIAGERRLRACCLNGMSHIPAIIDDVDDDRSAIFALIENLQRNDLNCFEEAAGIQLIIEQCSLTQAQAAQRLSMAQSTLANKLRLLKLDETTQRIILENNLTERHARALLKIADLKLQHKALCYIAKSNLNVKQTEDYIAMLIAPKPVQRANPVFIIKDVRILFNTINKAVDTVKRSGLEILTEQEEDEQFITYKVRVPKGQAPHKKRVTA